jgi:hypothetical protein
MSRNIQNQIEDLGVWWCILMHDSARWPIHGHYECASCGRRFPVPWERESHESESCGYLANRAQLTSTS